MRNIKVLEKQAKFNKDVNIIIDIIAPIICDKKITKREIDKANKALLAKFGVYDTYKNRNGGETVISNYYIAKYKDYSTIINIYCSDRSVNNKDKMSCTYIPESEKSIYMTHNQEILTKQELNRYKYSKKYMPTIKQIEKALIKYDKYQEQIKKINNKISDLPFHYYFNK